MEILGLLLDAALIVADIAVIVIIIRSIKGDGK